MVKVKANVLTHHFMISGRKDNKISSIKIIKYWVEVDESVSAESRHPTQPILPESAHTHTHAAASAPGRMRKLSCIAAL